MPSTSSPSATPHSVSHFVSHFVSRSVSPPISPQSALPSSHFVKPSVILLSVPPSAPSVPLLHHQHHSSVSPCVSRSVTPPSEHEQRVSVETTNNSDGAPWLPGRRWRPAEGPEEEEEEEEEEEGETERYSQRGGGRERGHPRGSCMSLAHLPGLPLVHPSAARGGDGSILASPRALSPTIPNHPCQTSTIPNPPCQTKSSSAAPTHHRTKPCLPNLTNLFQVPTYRYIPQDLTSTPSQGNCKRPGTLPYHPPPSPTPQRLPRQRRGGFTGRTAAPPLSRVTATT
ncbi:hypothetical protein O3P69_008939 [Scylla paramamosain]|uniref:Uncharacterized protein n=1 Tax=Scylla paramamosain TaxID=85552 RepID=A0AAW0TQJ2_SCYPA